MGCLLCLNVFYRSRAEQCSLLLWGGFKEVTLKLLRLLVLLPIAACMASTEDVLDPLYDGVVRNSLSLEGQRFDLYDKPQENRVMVKLPGGNVARLAAFGEVATTFDQIARTHLVADGRNCKVKSGRTYIAEHTYEYRYQCSEKVATPRYCVSMSDCRKMAKTGAVDKSYLGVARTNFVHEGKNWSVYDRPQESRFLLSRSSNGGGQGASYSGGTGTVGNTSVGPAKRYLSVTYRKCKVAGSGTRIDQYKDEYRYTC